MSTAQASETQPAGAPTLGGGAPSSLPDINSGPYPFEVVQHLIDEAAYLNMYSVPDAARTRALTAPGRPSEVIGFELRERLHRFEVRFEGLTAGSSRWAKTVVGEEAAVFSHRWLFMPDDFVAVPGRTPPPTALDPSRPQRFVMLEGTCEFETGDSFVAFGTGSTMPGQGRGPSVPAGAVGTILEGTGKFAGHEGTLTYNGALDPQKGYEGALLCRVVDPEGTLRTDREIPPAGSSGIKAEGDWLLFRGQKRGPQVKTYYDLAPDGSVQGFHLEQDLRGFDLRFTTEGRLGLRSHALLGKIIGKMRSRVFLDIFNPGAPGTDLAPIPFDSLNEYTLFEGYDDPAGSFVASGGEGRTFNLVLPEAPGQQALRFGAFQNVGEGTGLYSKIAAILTDNSVVGVAPHVTATLYTVRTP